MKKSLLTFITLITIVNNLYAQKTYTNSGPITIIDGDNYIQTGLVGSSYHTFIGLTGDGQTLLTTNFNSDLLFLNTTTDLFYDSLPLTTYDMAAASNDTMFIVGANQMYILRMSTKEVDSIAYVGNQSRIEKRPNTKEIWFSASNHIHVFNYNAAVTKNSFDISNLQYDNGDLKFSADGNYCYKINQQSMSVLKIDANTKIVVDSIKMSVNLFGIEVNLTNNNIYFSSSSEKKIYIANATTMTIIDSIVSNLAVFGLYNHPTREELWAVNHFNDKVTVYDRNTWMAIDTIITAGSPHMISFTNSGVNSIDERINFISNLYPNPVKDYLNLKGENDLGNNREFKIYNIQGEQIFDGLLEKNIDCRKLISGIYFLQIDSDTRLHKFIKE